MSATDATNVTDSDDATNINGTNTDAANVTDNPRKRKAHESVWHNGYSYHLNKKLNDSEYFVCAE